MLLRGAPLPEARHRLAELGPTHKGHAFVHLDVVARLPAHELRLAQITTNTNPTTAPDTTPRTVAARESNDTTVSNPPMTEESSTTARAINLLALNDKIPPSCFRSPRFLYPLD